MKNHLRLLLCLLAFSFVKVSIGQSCGCTIEEVTSNMVTPCDTIIGDVVNVSSVSQFYSALGQAQSQGGNMTILIEDGTYPLASTSQYPYITVGNLVIRSASGNRDAVILTGQGMQDVAPGTEIGLSIQEDNVIIADLTLRDVGNHAISMISDNHIIHNVKIQDTYEQMIKGNAVGDGPDNCTVQCSLFEYTDGIGPQWYIGGLDIHGGNNWIVRDNVFLDIASPSDRLAEHAVHFWDESGQNTVERNIIVGCDRGIGFGLGSSPNEGGIIRNNMIVNDGTDPFHDVGIGLETSPNTKVYNNTIHMAYPNAIEYRFDATTNVHIANNLTNRAITSRSNGSGLVENNFTNGQTAWYLNAIEGDLRLTVTQDQVVDQGMALSEVMYDIDQHLRNAGGTMDLGAQEFNLIIDEDYDGFAADVDCDDQNPAINPDAEEIPGNGIDEDCDGEDGELTNLDELAKQRINIYPNPVIDMLNIDLNDQETSYVVSIWSMQGQRLITTSKKSMNIGHFNSGIYLVTVVDDKGQTHLRQLVTKR